MKYLNEIEIKVTDKTHDYRGSFLNGEVYSADLLYKALEDLRDIQNPVLLDIGACTGSWALLDLVRPDFNIFSFEPSRAFSELWQNIRLNNSKTVIIDCAVSNKTGASEFNEVLDDNCIALSMLGGTPASHKRVERKNVPVTTIDSFFSKNSPIHESLRKRELDAKVDLIKIDTEGHELYVLQGAIETIKKYKPIIYCEYSNENTNAYGYDRIEIINFLEPLGYTIEFFGGADIIARS